MNNADLDARHNFEKGETKQLRNLKPENLSHLIRLNTSISIVTFLRRNIYKMIQVNGSRSLPSPVCDRDTNKKR